MKTVAGAIIQARTDSRRLPGKVLADVHGRTLIDHVVEAVRNVRGLEQLVVATSEAATDDRLATHCQRAGVPVFRGDLNNVAGRILAAAEGFNIDPIVRISGDSPLLSPVLVDQVFAVYDQRRWDLATNVHPRTFPTGQSVEVFSQATLTHAIARMSRTEHFEHTTAFFYDSSDRFQICNVFAPNDYSTIKMAVDEPEDLRRVRHFLASLSRPPWTFEPFDLFRRYAALEDQPDPVDPAREDVFE